MDSRWHSFKDRYSLTLTEQQEQQIIRHKPLAESRRIGKILKVARSTVQWSPKLRQEVSLILGPLAQDRVSVQRVRVIENSKMSSLVRNRNQSYPSFIMSMRRHVGNATGWSWVQPVELPLTLSWDQAFGRLMYDSLADRVTNREQTYVKDGLILRPQLTPSLLVGHKRDQVYTIGQVFRRDRKDRTHLKSFFQLEFRGSATGDPLTCLKDHITRILRFTGLDMSRIELRPTVYHYVAPAIQVFYNTGDGYTQIAGAGIMLDSVLESYGLCTPSGTKTMAGALGLDRIYCLVTGKTLDEL